MENVSNSVFSASANLFFQLFCFAAMKIHVSNDTKKVLDNFNTFILEERGAIEVKVRNSVENFGIITTDTYVVLRVVSYYDVSNP